MRQKSYAVPPGLCVHLLNNSQCIQKRAALFRQGHSGIDKSPSTKHHQTPRIKAPLRNRKKELALCFMCVSDLAELCRKESCSGCCAEAGKAEQGRAGWKMDRGFKKGRRKARRSVHCFLCLVQSLKKIERGMKKSSKRSKYGRAGI